MCPRLSLTDTGYLYFLTHPTRNIGHEMKGGELLSFYKSLPQNEYSQISAVVFNVLLRRNEFNDCDSCGKSEDPLTLSIPAYTPNVEVSKILDSSKVQLLCSSCYNQHNL